MNGSKDSQPALFSDATISLQVIADNISDVVWMTTTEKDRLVYVNKAFEDVWEQTREHLAANPMSFVDAIHPDDRPQVLAAMNRQAEGTYFETYRIITPSGRVKWIKDRAFPIRGPDGKIRQIVGIATNITADIERESQIRQQKELFETVVNNVPMMLSMYNERGEFEWVNPAWVQVLGWDLDAMKARDMLAEFYPDPEARQKVIDYMSQPQALWTEFETRTRSGTVIPTSWSNVRLSNGKCIGIGKDISARREQERLIARQQMQMVAAARLSSLGEMASSIAHEIKNPLAIISTVTQMLLQHVELGKPDLAKVQSGLERIVKTIERIVRIIKGLRAFSHQAEAEPFVPVPIQKPIEDVIELCRERCRSQGVELKTHVEPDLRVECREVQIAQVLINLVNNSLDALAGRSTSWIDITATRKGESVEITVTDSGPGIPTETAARMMEPFFTTKSVGRGTGLGLSISKGLIEDHGGTLTLDAAARNTRFVITLPLRQAQNVA